MSLGLTIVMLIASWLAVASAMLWGVLRISRRHQHRDNGPLKSATAVKRDKHDKGHSAAVH